MSVILDFERANKLIVVAAFFLVTIPTARTQLAQQRVKCSSNDFYSFVECADERLLASEWRHLGREPQQKLNADRAKLRKCFTDARCDNIGAAFAGVSRWSPSGSAGVELIERFLPAELRVVVRHVRQFFIDAPRAMQECLLSDARRRFLADLERCVHVDEGIGEFVLGVQFPPFPVPSQAMFETQKGAIAQFVDDRFAAVLALSNCSEQLKTAATPFRRSNVLKCIAGGGDAESTVRTCARDSFCGDRDGVVGCAQTTLPRACPALRKCLSSLTTQSVSLLDAAATQSASSKEQLLRFLYDCEERVRERGSTYRFSRVAVLKMYTELTRLKKQAPETLGKFNDFVGALLSAVVEQQVDVVCDQLTCDD